MCPPGFVSLQSVRTEATATIMVQVKAKVNVGVGVVAALVLQADNAVLETVMWRGSAVAYAGSPLSSPPPRSCSRGEDAAPWRHVHCIVEYG